MKYSNVIITVIVVLLAAIFIRLGFFVGTIKDSRDTTQSLIVSCQSLISANNNLEIEMANLRKQLGELEERFSRK